MNLDLFEDIIKDLKECKSFCNSNLACTKMFRRRILHRLSAIVASLHVTIIFPCTPPNIQDDKFVFHNMQIL
ncbi:unnamed protein product [Rhizophagus irregularis]|uniref:Uncharacterized protein n=1 Tax=Rhizophagus irregularis TaxID=588596 RepID=A0A915ZVS7_9GLOM|nr:unnamed protein product [Rhizophagus irregularis]CAB5187686.1 unnamed protein product [Rhizophagus irregularis]CAB5390144.1 unnamed protein product [Rhizophagus irregularis]